MLDRQALCAGLQFFRIDHDSPLGRWSFVGARPSGPLGEAVELFWTLDAEDSYTRELIFPRAATELMFTLGAPGKLHRAAGVEAFPRSWISGLQLAPLDVESAADAKLAAIRFRPGGGRPFFGLSPAELTGRVAVE